MNLVVKMWITLCLASLALVAGSSDAGQLPGKAATTVNDPYCFHAHLVLLIVKSLVPICAVCPGVNT